MTDEEFGIKQITGWDSIAEWNAYEQGKLDYEDVMMKWIEKWDGSTNSGLGELLMKKFKELQRL